MRTKFLGKLCIISAASGTGKSTLIHKLMQHNNFIYETQLSISYTTRSKRSNEIFGRDYYFISVQEFERMVDNNIFLEYAKVFNHYYGTVKYNIKNMLYSGVHVILNIDWQGAKQVRNKMDNVYTIFILPPSKVELERRLRIRGQDASLVIADRIKQSVNEISHVEEYDYVLVNDNLNIALVHLQSIILSEQLKYTSQKINCKKIINNLLLPD